MRFIAMDPFTFALAAPAHGVNNAMPLGTELGKTTCASVLQDKGQAWGVKSGARLSTWSGGTILTAANPMVEGLDGILATAATRAR